MKLRTFILALIASIAVAQPASAQLIPFDAGMNQLQREAMKQGLRTGGVEVGGSSSGGRSSAARAARLASSVSIGSTSYRSNPAVTERVKRQFSDYIGQTTTTSNGGQVLALLQRTDPVRNWSQIVASDGLRPGDAADALAAYWVLNWMIANQGDNNRTQTLAVRDQVRSTMTSNPTFSRLNEAQRQEMAEVLMLNFLMQHAAFSDAMRKRDQATLKRLGDAAVARFRSEMGVDLRQLQLTNSGFVRRG